MPLISSTLLATSITAWGIPKLQSLKFKQIIRQEGPKSHHNKAGTPTMGGLLILIGVLFGTLLWADLNNYYVCILLMVATNIMPSFSNSLEQFSIKRSTSATCSTTSIANTTENFFSVLKFSGEQCI